MLDWIDDMLGMTLQQFHRAPHGEQFQAALTAMAVTSFVLFKAGYFLSLAKCSLIPEQFMTYLVIDCKTVNNSTHGSKCWVERNGLCGLNFLLKTEELHGKHSTTYKDHC